MMAILRLKYVNSFPDRHGRPRHYFRRPGHRSVPLPGLPGSPEFMTAYQAALANVPPPIDASRTKAGTVNAVIVAYYASRVFREELAPTTQRMRRNILERFRSDHGDKWLVDMQPRHVNALLDTMKPYARKNWLKTLRGLMAFAVANNLRADDPTANVKVKAPKSLGHMTWHEPQIEQYRKRHPIGTMARLALELLLNTAARRYDTHTLGHQHISEGRLCWRPHKTKRSTAKMLKIGIMPELQHALDAMPRAALSFLTTEHGKPFASAAAFGNKFADWCRAAGLKPVLCEDGKVRSYRAHGLRKAALTRAAHAGCTAPELMGLSGHATLVQLQVYLDEVNQEHQADAALAKVRAKTETSDLQTLHPQLTNLRKKAREI
jgi:integrase/recombinase XerD